MSFFMIGCNSGDKGKNGTKIPDDTDTTPSTTTPTTPTTPTTDTGVPTTTTPTFPDSLSAFSSVDNFKNKCAGAAYGDPTVCDDANAALDTIAADARTTLAAANGETTVFNDHERFDVYADDQGGDTGTTDTGQPGTVTGSWEIAYKVVAAGTGSYDPVSARSLVNAAALFKPSFDLGVTNAEHMFEGVVINRDVDGNIVACSSLTTPLTSMPVGADEDGSVSLMAFQSGGLHYQAITVVTNGVPDEPDEIVDMTATVDVCGEMELQLDRLKEGDSDTSENHPIVTDEFMES